MSFLDKNIAVLRMTSFVLVIACNVLLIANSSSRQEYFSKADISDPFMILLVINLVVGIMMMLLYCIK